MELRQYFSLFWKWLWLIALCALLAGGTAFVVSKRAAPVYRATATLMINEARSPAQTSYSDVLMAERTAKTYAERLVERPVLDAVAAELGLARPPLDRFPDGIDAISVQPVRDTQLVRLSVESTDPQLAARVADLLPRLFIQRNEEQLSTRYASSKDSLSRQLTGVQADVQSAQAALDGEKAKARPDPAELARLQSMLAQYQNSYNTLLRSYQDVRLAEAQALPTIVVTEPATVPVAPVKPNTRQNTLLAAIVGAMLAVGVAFLAEYLDDTLKTPDDVRAATGLATLGIVRRIQAKEPAGRLVTHRHPRSPVAESFRVLRTNLQFSSFDRPLRTLLVTSAGPGEGKSTVVANLAVAMAQAGKSVVVVDTDLRRPVLHHIFDVPNSHGLTTALMVEDDSRMLANGDLQPTAVPNLRILTTGPLPPNPSELLGSQKMRRLVGCLTGSADVVLFDSPPALMVADASVLASAVDGVLLIADAAATRPAAAARARDSLAQVGATVLGVAINKLRTRGRAGYGYGDYYYDYYYSSAGDDAPRGRHRPAWRRLLRLPAARHAVSGNGRGPAAGSPDLGQVPIVEDEVDARDS